MRRKTLKGYSGCQIELIEDSTARYFVRKTSSSEIYNLRLDLQIKKQMNFRKSGFRVPEIINTGFNEKNLKYFDMEYVPGLKFSEHMNSSLTKRDSVQLIELLEQLQATEHKTISKEKIEMKLFDYKKIERTDLPIILAVDFLEKYDWNTVNPTECHGDLTLENMIVNERGIHLVDFQDVAVDSSSQDIAKLLLDLEWNWSTRFTIDESTLIRNYGNRIYLRRNLESGLRLMKRPEYSYEIVVFQLFNILRMLPYVKDYQSDKLVTNMFTSIAKRLQII